jgi:hypothetical protein
MLLSWHFPANFGHRALMASIPTCVRLPGGQCGYGTPCGLADLLFCLAVWRRRSGMNGLIYLIGLIVVIMAILSFFGLR